MYHLDSGEVPRLSWRIGGRMLLIEPWGADSVRVRAAIEEVDDTLPRALDRTLIEGGAWRESGTAETRPDGTALLVNGRLTVQARTVEAPG